MNDRPDERQAPPASGLCATCRHTRVIVSDRGSVFVQCALARDDPRFARYPRLPMLACPGYLPAEKP